ncbi:MAG: ATP-dependent protease subunit HslV [Rickettsiaceae bacterium]|nr:ATP-dependent protease subunit HslV [Rickettsiaceae bacterium]
MNNTQNHHQNNMHGTTILCVKKNGEVVIGADGQVSIGNMIFKSNTNKLRRLADGKILSGFAGSTADAFALFERLESKLEKYSGNLVRACVELAKDWRTDKFLRRLEAMLIVADKDNILILSGNGDVIEPEYGIASIGSGGFYARAAAKALVDNTTLSTEDIVKKSMEIAASICVFSNNNILIEKIS